MLHRSKLMSSLKMETPLSLETPLGEDIVSYKKRPLHHITREDHKEIYNEETTTRIQCIYIVAAVLWVLVVYVSGIYNNNDCIAWFFLALPLIIYMVNYVGATEFTVDLENEMFRGNFLSFGYLIVLIFINWSTVADKNKFFRILILALVFIMLSLVDIWVNKEHLALAKHVRSVLHTAALALLAYALYLYYLDQVRVQGNGDTVSEGNAS